MDRWIPEMEKKMKSTVSVGKQLISTTRFGGHWDFTYGQHAAKQGTKAPGH